MSGLFGAKPLEVIKTGWPLVSIALVLSLIGLLTMHTFDEGNSFAPRQMMWIALGLVLFFICASLNMQFLRRTTVIVTGYAISILLLSILIFVDPIQGAKSWFSIGAFSFQPADAAKIFFIALLAKYFSRRHMEIGHLWHIVLSAIYAGIPMLFILMQPDLGTAAILGIVWFGMILLSGLSKKHLILAFIIGIVAASLLWFVGLHDYQRTRIVAFLNPAADIRGSGYNAYQAVVAVGSGELFGKGIGYGTQSKLRFLPEYETDFIFAAFAEEWGFVGVTIILILYGLLLTQLVLIAKRAATNFDALFTIGVALLFLAHAALHIGINLGLLPVTGTTIPFMSSGGSHIAMEFILLGIVVSLAQHARSAPRSALQQEYIG